MIHVRPYVSDDRTFVLSLAPRLLIGMPPWRDPQLWLSAFQNWITRNQAVTIRTGKRKEDCDACICYACGAAGNQGGF